MEACIGIIGIILGTFAIVWTVNPPEYRDVQPIGPEPVELDDRPEPQGQPSLRLVKDEEAS